MKKHIMPVIAAGLFLSSCGGNISQNPRDRDTGAGLPVTADPAASGKEEVPLNDPSCKYVQKVEMNFTVKDAVHSMQHIEAIARRQEGIVSSSELHTMVTNERSVNISADSVRNLKSFTVNCDMTICVPSRLLDSTLDLINGDIQFLGSRVRTMTDVSLLHQAQQLETKRNAESHNKLSGKKEIQAVAAANGYAAAKDVSLINDKQLMDESEFSDIHIIFTQPVAIASFVTVNSGRINDDDAGFGWQLWSGIKAGAFWVEKLIVGLIYIWPVFLISLAAYWGFKKYRKPGTIS